MSFQLGAALLDACVLAVLKKGDTYGYVLTQKVKEVLNISESSLYPVLRRLQKNGYLTTYDEPFQGRNRRYYKISDLGLEKLDEYLLEWTDYEKKINFILLGEI